MFGRTREYVEKRYSLVGGIPRFVLEKPDDIEPIIDLAIARLTIDKFYLISTGQLVKDDRISHLAVHIYVDQTYMKESLQMGSVYIAEKTLERFILTQEQTLRQFLSYTKPIPMIASLRGNLFEAYAHRVLSAGGKFTIRSLEAGQTKTITLPPLQTDRYYELSKCTANKYYIPWNPNYACNDSFIPSKYLFQMTVSNDHPIKISALLEIMKHTKLSSLVFVVPGNLYNTFPLQRLDSKSDENP
ncbi:hypothetical protein HDV03_003007, partial [Kappamyces sp. JEL0829]